MGGVKAKLIFYCLTLNPLLLYSQEADEDAIRLTNSPDFGYFFKHLAYLASDELRGRDVGSRGYELAANYMARQFMLAGLQPFGDSGTWFQPIEFVKPSINDASVSIRVVCNSRSAVGRYGRNVSLLANRDSCFYQHQQLAFVGYGNIVPEDGIDDYKGVDVRGKTVIVAVGGPESMKNPAFDDIRLKVSNARSRGAQGIILFYPRGRLIQNLIFSYAHGFLTRSSLHFADTSIRGSTTDTGLRLAMYAKLTFIRRIFGLNGLNLGEELRAMERGQNRSRNLGMSLECSYKANIECISSKNVMAALPGTDPTLQNEFVVIGAHLDHLGVGKPGKGDSVYNGMVDNASGCAALLSIARAFSQLPGKPKRSIVFAAYTAEEEGLLGSHYFVNRNRVGNGRIVANLNLDMIANLFENRSIIPVGYLHSNLADAVDYAVGFLDLEISANRNADLAYVERGDQLSFIKQGIPSLFIVPGNTPVDPKINGYKRTNRWLRKYYHSPLDDLKQDYSEKSFLTGVKLNFLILYYIANRMETIEWNRRSWFPNKYAAPNSGNGM